MGIDNRVENIVVDTVSGIRKIVPQKKDTREDKKVVDVVGEKRTVVQGLIVYLETYPVFKKDFEETFIRVFRNINI